MRRVYLTLVEIFGNILGLHPDAISPQTSLTHLRYCDLGAAVIACEKLFHIQMADERIPSLENLAMWTDYIKECIREQRDQRPAPTQEERDQWYYE